MKYGENYSSARFWEYIMPQMNKYVYYLNLKWVGTCFFSLDKRESIRSRRRC
jgi:hypothetical protein